MRRNLRPCVRRRYCESMWIGRSGVGPPASGEGTGTPEALP